MAPRNDLAPVGSSEASEGGRLSGVQHSELTNSGVAFFLF